MAGSAPIFLDLSNEAATLRLGEDLAIALRAGDIVALDADLGMGKSTLARAIIRAIADDEGLEVPSPTFTLVQSYALRIPVHHFDLYRLSEPEELEELGLAEALDEGIALVEWPDRAPSRLQGAIHVKLSEIGDGRRVEIHASEAAITRIERSLAIRFFLDRAGYVGARRRFMFGDASVRTYETIDTLEGDQLILMDAPERSNEPVVRDGKPYSRIAGLAQSVAAFVGVSNGLLDQGFAAPRTFAMDLEAGLLVIEHLGKVPFLMPDGSANIGRYEEAARLLAAIHQREWPAVLPVADGITHVVPIYDRAAFEIEAALMLDWYVPYVRGCGADAGERSEFSKLWQALVDRLLASEQSLVLRDYHSPNLIWREEREGFDRLGIIDVQDAVFGPAAYDVASLSFDARVDVPVDVEQAVVEAYCAARGAAFDRDAFEEAYAITAAHRNTKILGIFVRLAQRDGKPGYLKHLPRIRRYIRRALSHTSLAELRAFYDARGLLEGDEE
jgi:tRNA threonylcarbamoyl adenosine modification protein YjeE